MNKRLSSRQREALALAERCARVLQDRFGARRVVPFGSMVGEGPWHEGSDLDLAVTLDGGLPRGKRWPQVLLGRMGEPGGRGRPILFDGSLLLELDEYRRFRHRVWPIYGYKLEAERVLTLAQGVKSILGWVKVAVAAFNAWLEEQVGRGD